MANKTLNAINIYLLSNQLHINISKSVFMHFKPNIGYEARKTSARTRPFGQDYTININGIKIRKVHKVRFLGVIIDEQLNWDEHIEYLEQKLNSCIVTIKRIRKFIPQKHYKKLYHTLFESHLVYGITAWGGTSKTKLLKILSIQKRCIRLLFGEKFCFDHREFYETCARVREYAQHIAPKNFELESTKPIFYKHKLLNVYNLHKQFTYLETFKILKYHYPSCFLSLLKLKKCKAPSKMYLQPHQYKSSKAKKHYIHNGISLWNKLSRQLFTSPPLNPKLNLVIPGSCNNSDLTTPYLIIKKRLKNFLIEYQNNSISEKS